MPNVANIVNRLPIQSPTLGDVPGDDDTGTANTAFAGLNETMLGLMRQMATLQQQMGSLTAGNQSTGDTGLAELPELPRLTREGTTAPTTEGTTVPTTEGTTVLTGGGTSPAGGTPVTTDSSTGGGTSVDPGSQAAGGMSGETAAVTMAAYMKKDFHGKTISHDQIVALQTDPTVSQQVRDAATYFVHNQGAQDEVDGAQRGKLDGKDSVSDFEAYVKNGAQVDPTQEAALEMSKYIGDNKTGDLRPEDMARIQEDPNATEAEKSAAAYFQQNPDALSQADGIQKKGKDDGIISGKDFTKLAQAQVDDAGKAATTLNSYLTRNDNALHRFLSVLKDIGMAVAGVAAALIPGVGEVADAALIGGEVAGEAAAAGGEAAAAGGEAAAVAGDAASSAATAGESLGQQAVRAGFDQAKDWGKDQIQNALTPQQQGPVEDGSKKGHTVNLAGLEKLSTDPGTPLSVRNAASYMLAHPDMLTQLDGENSGGKTDGTFNSKDLKAYNQQQEKDIQNQEDAVQVDA